MRASTRVCPSATVVLAYHVYGPTLEHSEVTAWDLGGIYRIGMGEYEIWGKLSLGRYSGGFLVDWFVGVGVEYR